MAYMSQENKKEKLAKMKVLLKEKYPEYKIKFTMGVRNHSTLIFNLWKSTIDFAPFWRKAFGFNDLHEFKYWNPNEYWLEQEFSGKILDLFQDIKNVMMEGNHNRSDIMTDYFDVGWYIDINIGRYDKPYERIE